MNKILDLIKEYKIRFHMTKEIMMAIDTENIPEKYGIDNNEILVTSNIIYNGKYTVYRDGIWAIADIRVMPKHWVIKRDDMSPIWKRIKKEIVHSDLADTRHEYFSSSYFGYLLNFSNHQFLTLEQYDRLSGKVKVGDFGIFYDDNWKLGDTYDFGQLDRISVDNPYPYMSKTLNVMSQNFFKVDSTHLSDVIDMFHAKIGIEKDETF